MKLFAKVAQLFSRIFGSPKVSIEKPGVTLFYFTGSSNSWISRGQTLTLNPFEHTFTATGATRGIVTVSVQTRIVHKGSYDVTFVSPVGQRLAVGEYTAATRYPFQKSSDPGLCFSGQGRCNNRLIGNFRILEFRADRQGRVEAFAADFCQYDEEQKGAWNFGSIRYNSQHPLNDEGSVDVEANWAVARFGGRLSPQDA